MTARGINASIGVWRLCWGFAAFMMWPYNPIAGLYGVIEIASSCAAIWNSHVAVEVDDRAIGWLTPCLYMLGYMFVAVPGDWNWVMVWALLLVGLFRLWSFCSLGFGYSVGCPTFVELAAGGPYKVLRHPMQFSGLCSRLVFCLAVPHWANWLGLGVMTVAGVGVVLLEEGFLRRRPEWCEYAAAVRWRLFPGVW